MCQGDSNFYLQFLSYSSCYTFRLPSQIGIQQDDLRYKMSLPLKKSIVALPYQLMVPKADLAGSQNADALREHIHTREGKHMLSPPPTKPFGTSRPPFYSFYPY